jgi:hypothetical protein
MLRYEKSTSAGQSAALNQVGKSLGESFAREIRAEIANALAGNSFDRDERAFWLSWKVAQVARPTRSKGYDAREIKAVRDSILRIISISRISDSFSDRLYEVWQTNSHEAVEAKAERIRSLYNALEGLSGAGLNYKEASQAAKQIAELAKITKEEEVLHAAVEIFSICRGMDVIASTGYRMLMRMQQLRTESSADDPAEQIRSIGMASLEARLLRR